MAEAMVTITKKEYQLLKKYRKLVDSEFEEKFTREFLEDVKKSEEAHKRGEYIRCETTEERKKLFDSL